MKHLCTLLLLCGSMLLSAQPDSTGRFANSPVFFHFGLGLFPHVENFNAEVSAAVGYRFDEYVGLGLEYRLSATSNVSFARSASLLGLRLRGQHPRGWLASVGGGTVVSATRGDDGFTEYNYRAGGYYLATEAGYQFRRGITLSLYLTTVQDQSFDVSEFNFDTDTYEPTGAFSEDNFAGFGVKLGYAFPSRGKHRRVR